jgi:pimeloyl-ACP methyl ester carboxylesterase
MDWESAFLAEIEEADPRELAELLRRPGREKERLLRVHLGDERYRRLHGLALRRGAEGESRPRGNVVVIPGLMGSQLTAFGRDGEAEPIWLNLALLLDGHFDRLRLAVDGHADQGDSFAVRASGILKRYYGELLLTLGLEWNVRAFWYDWRKDVRLASAALEARLADWFPAGAPVHLVAHGMGGLVARAFAKGYPERWKAIGAGWSCSARPTTGRSRPSG